ncbi:Protein of unknown function [Gryllus bimaculatus]|nr:Protein of unknown function [Gryllus bimaculatus]
MVREGRKITKETPWAVLVSARPGTSNRENATALSDNREEGSSNWLSERSASCATFASVHTCTGIGPGIMKEA